MKAIQLTAFEGFQALRMVEAEVPKAGPGEVLIRVKASGVNFAELEMTEGRYPSRQAPPFIMGFEAAGTVVETGVGVTGWKAGDRVAAVASSGGYAEYATASASACIPIPEGISFAEATTIPVQGVSAYALLELAAKPDKSDVLLIQAAAGGVGLYLVQLSKILGVERVVALAGSESKIALLRELGADVAVNYGEENWPEQVRESLGGRGVDIVLEAASGKVGAESFRLLEPNGRMVVYGARNIHDMMTAEQMRQLIIQNQTITGFNIPTVAPERIAPLVPRLLDLIARRQVRLFAGNVFPLGEVQSAFGALSSRTTIGKVVLTV